MLALVGVTAPASAQKIYWVDLKLDTIRRANLDGSAVETLPIPGVTVPWSIAIDPFAKKIYWTENKTGFPSLGFRIRRANFDGSNVVNLVVNVPHVAGLALDLTQGMMYWTSHPSNVLTFQRSRLNGTGIEDLIAPEDGSVGYIALDPFSERIYFADGRNQKIYRTYLDGSNFEELVSMAPDGPNGIALDLSAGKMYWTLGSAFGVNKVQRADLDGSNIEDLATTVRFPSGIALDISEGKIYWSSTGEDVIMRANLDGSDVEEFIEITDPLGSSLRGIAILPNTACCEELSGACENSLAQEYCNGEHQTWTRRASCSQVACVAANGACCDTGSEDAAIAECSVTTIAECVCQKCTWTKGATCDEVLCDANFIPIPAVSEWGLVAIALLLLTGGKIYFRGKRPKTLTR